VTSELGVKAKHFGAWQQDGLARPQEYGSLSVIKPNDTQRSVNKLKLDLHACASGTKVCKHKMTSRH